MSKHLIIIDKYDLKSELVSIANGIKAAEEAITMGNDTKKSLKFMQFYLGRLELLLHQISVSNEVKIAEIGEENAKSPAEIEIYKVIQEAKTTLEDMLRGEKDND